MWPLIRAMTWKAIVCVCLFVVALLVLAYWLGGHFKTEKAPVGAVMTQNVNNVPAIAPAVVEEKVEEPPVAKAEEAKPAVPVAPADRPVGPVVVKAKIRVTIQQ